jgi:hypothetical protein
MYPIPWVLLNTRQDGSGRCYWLPFDHFEMDLKVPWLSYHQIRSVSFCMIYSQIANPQISTKYCTTKSPNSAKSRLCKLFFMYKLELQCRVLYALLVRRNSMYLRKFKVRKPQKDRVRKSQIRNVPHFRKDCKFNKLLKSANLRVCSLQNLFTDCPPFKSDQWQMIH